MSGIMLCTDSASVRYPEALGLEGEQLGAQEWLEVLSDAHEARIRVREGRPEEVWVAGSDEIDAINLAAALKHDGSDSKVCLLAFSGSGSLMSRAQVARIDEVWDKRTFLDRYRRAKAARASAKPVAKAHFDQPHGEISESGLDRHPGVPFAAGAPLPGNAAGSSAAASPSEASRPSGVSPAGVDPAGIDSAGARLADARPVGGHSSNQNSVGLNPAEPDSAGARPEEEDAFPETCRPSGSSLQTATTERGYLLSVVGAGGGVGKSSVAVVAAYIAQSKGYRTALVDADLQFGDVQYLTGREDALPVDEAVGSPGRLDALDCRGRQPAVLAAPARLEHSEELAARMPALVEDLRARFDVVVVNTSPTWGDVHIQLLEAGGNALFLIDQRPSSIRSCKHALQLCARCGVATQPIVFAINRCSRQSLFSSIDVACALQGAHVVELSEGGRDVEELLGTGAPVELVDSGNALCQSVERVLSELLPKQAGAEPRTITMPSRKRIWFGSRRKKAACL